MGESGFISSTVIHFTKGTTIEVQKVGFIYSQYHGVLLVLLITINLLLKKKKHFPPQILLSFMSEVDCLFICLIAFTASFSVNFANFYMGYCLLKNEIEELIIHNPCCKYFCQFILLTLSFSFVPFLLLKRVRYFLTVTQSFNALLDLVMFYLE